MKQPNPKTVRFDEKTLLDANERSVQLGIPLNKYIVEAVKKRNKSGK